ncbi:hypothetical protein NFI96_023047 [Prochilodus magdalenae]|nr:hypothetical protein NFI96_023047 [Prochilodus magdalenae]
MAVMAAVLTLWITSESLLSLAVKVNTIIHQNLSMETITKPYEEFCSSGRCIYTVPPKFHERLKNENWEAGWHSPVEGLLADPSDPNNLHSAVIKTTPESLITKWYMDGVWIDIQNHETNEHLKIIFKATNNTHASPQGFAVTSGPLPTPAVASTSASPKPPDQPSIQTITLTVVGSILAVLAVVLCYYRKSICRWIRSQKDKDKNWRNIDALKETQALNLAQIKHPDTVIPSSQNSG